MSPLFTLEVFGLVIPDTLVVSALLTAVLGLAAWAASRRLRVHDPAPWQVALEELTGWIDRTVGDVVAEDPRPYTPLIGALMIFIAACNLLSPVPYVRPPTTELANPAALALVVFLAVPAYGIRRRGLLGYLRTYAEPTPFLLPLNLLGDITRTLALCVRLFGNALSGQMIGAILLVVAGFLVPVPLLLLGLMLGLIQAYIFGVLAAVFISAAIQVERRPEAAEGDAP